VKKPNRANEPRYEANDAIIARRRPNASAITPVGISKTFVQISRIA